MSDIHVVKAGNLENAFIMLNTPENAERREKLKEKLVTIRVIWDHTSLMVLVNTLESAMRVKNPFLGTIIAVSLTNVRMI